MLEPMTLEEYDKALRNPTRFVKTYIRSNKLTKEYIAKGSGMPITTIKSFLEGTRPKTRVETMNKYVAFVLKHRRLRLKNELSL